MTEKQKKDKQFTVSKDIIHIIEMMKWTISCENGAFEKRFEWKFWNWKYIDGNEKCNKWTWQYIKPKVSRKKEIVKKSKNINEMQNKNKKYNWFRNKPKVSSLKRWTKSAILIRKKEKKKEILNTVIKRGIILQIMKIPKR